MEDDDRYLVPCSNLSESIHGSWLATNNGVKYMSLYDACLSNLVCWARYVASLKGQQIGFGPTTFVCYDDREMQCGQKDPFHKAKS